MYVFLIFANTGSIIENLLFRITILSRLIIVGGKNMKFRSTTVRPFQDPNALNLPTQEEALIRDRKNHLEKVNKLKENYPQIIQSAANYLKQAIKQKSGLDIDPNNTFFNRFKYASSSSETITGWQP